MNRKNDCFSNQTQNNVSHEMTSENDIDELLESEAKYRSFIENLSVMFYAAEPCPPYSPIYISPAFAQFGYPLEEWRENVDMWMRALHTEDRDWVLRDTAAAMQAGEETDFEYRIVAKNGDVHWVRDRGSFTRDDEGNIICWQGIILDITERKLDEQKLQRNEKLYRTLARNIPQTAVVLFDRNFRYNLADGMLLKKHGFSREMFEGKTLREVFPPEIYEEWSDYYRRALSGETVSFEQKSAEGYFQTYVVPVRNDCGEIFAGMVMWQDITERKQAEFALKESERRYRQMFEKNQSIKIIIDADTGAIVDINPAACDFYGYTSAEFKTKNIADLNTLPAEQVAEELKRAKTERRNYFFFRHRLASGEVRDVEVHSSPLQDRNQNLLYSIIQDVTERKQTERDLKDSEERYRDLFENANDLIYTHDLQGNFTSLNRAGEIVTGYSRDEALTVNLAQVVAPEYLEAARGMIACKIAGEAATTYELEIVAKPGHRVSLELSTRIIYQNGKPVGVQGIGRDITERKRAEESLVNSERLYRLLGEGIMHQIWTAYPDGRAGYFNGRALEYLGRTSEQMQNDGWEAVIHPDDLPECRRRWAGSLKTGEDYEVEFRLRRYDGEYRWFHARATAGHDEEGKVIIWFGTNTDVDDQKKAEAKLNHIAGHDTLTNLPNRAKFMNHLEQAINSSEHNPTFRFAVLFLDLDRFKIINDSLGHTTGDKLLIAFAKRLEECVRPDDVVARLGGDEFTVLLRNIQGTADAVRVASRFLEKLSSPFKLDTYEVFTSASIGIIISDEVRRQPEDFLRDADTAMYRAKEAGKSRYEIFDREMHIRNMNILEMETDLRRAIENNEFRVFYQPIVALDTGEVREFEALIRWQHPRRGLVAPNEFVGIAEETGLINPIGQWILKEACRQTVEWQKMMPLADPMSISVNLSAKQLMHPNLNAQVIEVLQQTALNPRCLKLEVTESMVMENSEKALAVISELRSLGISLSTDDFGTAYSSLSYLHRFPFNRLKIDRSFVSKMDSDQKSEAIVRTILLLAQNLNIEVVAEGIETERQLAGLRKLGCRIGQGYLFSKPVNAETATRILHEGLPNDFNQSHFSFVETGEREVLELDKIQ